MKRCSTSYVFRELRFNTVGYHYTPIRIAKMQNTDNSKCWRGCRATQIHILLVGMRHDTTTLEDSLAVWSKIKNTLTMQPSNHNPWYLLKC